MTEHIKTVSSPELLAAAQKAYEAAKVRRAELREDPNASGADYLIAIHQEHQAKAQLEAIRNTQYKNVFIEQNAAKGLSQ